MQEKRGQELSIGTLILIVLGIIVLVLLVLGFSMGWENLFSKIGIFQGSDLSSVVTACELAVTSDSKTSFCECRSVKLPDGTKAKVNCAYPDVQGLSTKVKEKAVTWTNVECKNQIKCS